MPKTGPMYTNTRISLAGATQSRGTTSLNLIKSVLRTVRNQSAAGPKEEPVSSGPFLPPGRRIRGARDSPHSDSPNPGRASLPLGAATSSDRSRAHIGSIEAAANGGRSRGERCARLTWTNNNNIFLARPGTYRGRRRRLGNLGSLIEINAAEWAHWLPSGFLTMTKWPIPMWARHRLVQFVNLD